VVFDPGSAVPSSGADATLKQIADAFGAHSDHTVSVSGHADASEKPKELRLSSFRARKVRDALVALGVPAQRVSTYAYGDDRPSEEAADAGTTRNRRVEVVLIPPPRPPPPGTSLYVPVYGASVVFMSAVGFAPGSARLSPALSRLLEGVAEVLLARSWLAVEITGHADPSEPARERLSQRRARAALKHLVELGVPEGQLTANGHGSKADPWVPGADGPARNRSVGFQIFKGD
jgi:outer membrane protein OmpA-like peptidoglycan-associated protein